MVEGLIVAAGQSRRTLPYYKMTLDLGGKTLVERAMASMEPYCEHIIVVTGYQGDLVRSALQGHPKVELVDNPNYQEGMFSSMKTGLPYIKGDRFFFLPGDYPIISPSVYEAMLAVDYEIVVPVHEGQTGHPVLLKYSVIERIFDSPEITSLREFIRQRDPCYLEVNCPGILIDIDTMEDYQRALALIAQQEGC